MINTQFLKNTKNGWQCIGLELQLHFVNYPDNKVYGAYMGPTWVLSAPGGPHVGPKNFAIWVSYQPIIGQLVLNNQTEENKNTCFVFTQRIYLSHFFREDSARQLPISVIILR